MAIGCGDLESFFHQGYASQHWPEIERLAEAEPSFRRALTSVWASQEFERLNALLWRLGEWTRFRLSLVLFDRDGEFPSPRTLASMTRVDVETTVEIGRRDDPDEVNHLMCCRADPLVAFCGYPGDHINLASTFLCAMCVEEVNRMRPGWMRDDIRVCPIDSSPCPTEAEIDERINDLTS